jgi:hypothetical protein
MTPQAYPLAWPAFRPRTTANKRRRGHFTKDGRAVTLAAAAGRVQAEVERLGGRDLIISTNIEPTLSGRPRAGQAKPADAGVAVYFQLAGEPIALACDTFDDVAQNLGGLAGHIQATRTIERYGVQKAIESLRAFMALPAPAPGRKPWRQVLGLHPEQSVTVETIKTHFRHYAQRCHPDKGGSAEAMNELQAARDEALEAISAEAGA